MDSFVRGTIKTAIYGTKAPPTAELHGHISYTQSEDHAFSILKEKETALYKIRFLEGNSQVG